MVPPREQIGGFGGILYNPADELRATLRLLDLNAMLNLWSAAPDAGRSRRSPPLE
jgi:hypothetical protein